MKACQDVYKRQGSVLQTGDDAVVLVHAAGGQAHGQTHTLLNDGALQEDCLLYTSRCV